MNPNYYRFDDPDNRSDVSLRKDIKTINDANNLLKRKLDISKQDMEEQKKEYQKKIRLLKNAHKFELRSLKEDIKEKMYDIVYLNLIPSFNKI